MVTPRDVHCEQSKFSDALGKVLHHWNNFVTYNTSSVFEINASIKCSDVLNSLNDDILQREIDELVNEAIQIELPHGCICDCCMFASENT